MLSFDKVINNEDISFTKLKTRFDGYASFCVEISVDISNWKELVSCTLDSNNWPEVVLVRRFYKQRNGEHS